MYHVNVNVNLTEQNVIQVNGEITINFDLSVKITVYETKIMFGILSTCSCENGIYCYVIKHRSKQNDTKLKQFYIENK